jgi:ATP-dependent DNA ligase
MLAASAREVPSARAFQRGMQAELKFDGFRAWVRRHGSTDGVEIRSRQGRILTDVFPDIAAAVVLQMPAGTTLDGELVIWAGGRMDFSALQSRMASRRRAATLAGQAPATLMVFDLLERGGVDLRGRPLRERRQYLEDLMAAARPPLQLVPATTDREVALAWARDYAAARVGIEGLVLKPLDSLYVPGRRGWTKVRTMTTTEAVIGAVTGSPDAPERLILGLPDGTGVLRIAGSTLPLTSPQAQQVAGLLQPLAEADHPWSTLLLTRHLNAWGRSSRRPIVTVQPRVVVEVEIGTGGPARQWRELARFHRTRSDLDLGDLAP